MAQPRAVRRACRRQTCVARACLGGGVEPAAGGASGGRDPSLQPPHTAPARGALAAALRPAAGAVVGAAVVLLSRVLPAAAAAAGGASSAAQTSSAAATTNLPLLLAQAVAFAAALRGAFIFRGFIRARTSAAVAKFKAQWKGALFIPVCAAAVGWITNWIAVQMIFYPISFLGLPLKQYVLGTIYGCDVLSPLGWVGWQGIVPAKAAQMALNMVSMVTDKLIDVQEVFYRLDPSAVAALLSPQLPELALGVSRDAPLPGWLVSFAERGVRAGKLGPQLSALAESFQQRFLEGFTRALQAQVNNVLDLKELVVTSMVADRRLIVELFQKCGRKELTFLVDSGLWFGFILGLIQMAVWMFYDSPWTLTAGGAIVGYITNWAALKCIFEPVEPTRYGPFVLQGMFLKRQREVSAEFADFFVDRVLTSRKMFDTMMTGIKAPQFRALLRDYTCADFVPTAAAALAPGAAALDAVAEHAEVTDVLRAVCAEACDRAADRLPLHLEPVHDYVDATLALRTTIKAKLELMSPAEFERVLHPIFEEDEMTLVIAGAVLGAIAGYIQQITTVPEPAAEEKPGSKDAAPR